MATITPEAETATEFRTLADVIDRLGVPAHRILARPAPGTATVEDVVALEARENRLAELVDGVLVEKAMGYFESGLACALIHLIWVYLERNPVGGVAGEGGMMRLLPHLVRIPDVSVVSWDRFPGRRVTREPVPAIAPDLAVEVLSESNTRTEMDRKLGDYFAAGARLVWYLDPEDRTVRVYTSVDKVTLLDQSGTLDGGDVLPGFALPIREWFERAERPFAGRE